MTPQQWTVRGACSPLEAACCSDPEGDTSQSSGILKGASGRGAEPEGRLGPPAALGTITVNSLSELSSANLIISLLSVFFFPSYCFVFVLHFDSVV